jgi:hypothetical protein
MGTTSFVQSSFLGGEWSQTMQGRIDVPAYKIAMNVCFNGFPIAEGAWTRRPGFEFAANTRSNAAARLVTYNFQQNAPYTMEFTDGYLRFYRGSALVTTNDTVTVASISSANPAVVTTTSAHGWSTGNQGYFGNLGVACPLLHRRQVVITVTGSFTFTIADALTGASINGATLGTMPAGATFSRIMELTTPYIGNSWSSLRMVQADNAAVLLNPSFRPYVLSVQSQPSELANATFALSPVNFADGPYLDPPRNGAVLTPSGTTGIIGLTISFPAYDSTRAYARGDFCTSASISYQSLIDQNLNNTPASSPSAWLAVPASIAVGPNGFQASDVGRHVRLCNEPALWSSSATYGTGTAVSYNGTYYTSLTASNTGFVPGTDTVHWGLAPQAGIWTWGKIVSLQNQIPNSLPGSTALGNMGVGAFSGVDDQNYNQSSHTSLANTGSPVAFSGFVGRDFSAATPQQILSATFYPSTDFGIFTLAFNPETGNFVYAAFVINLRASQTLPANAAAGALLGSYGSPQQVFGQYSQNSMGTEPVTITSNDQATAWKYVWFEVIGAWNVTNADRTVTGFLACGQAKFFGTVTGSTNGVQFQILGTNLLNTNAVRLWRLGLFNGATGWPTCGTYHEGRIWIAGSVNNRFDGSKPNQDLNGGVSFAPTESDGTVTAANGISYTLNAPTTNTILAMKPDQQGIVIYTERGEWLVQATTANQPLTATNIQAHQVTRIGSSINPSAQPIQCEHTTLFIQRYSQSVMEYFADVFSGKFSAPDIAQPAKHIAGRVIEEICYQQTISPVVWARCADGTLVGCSYRRDSLMSSQGPAFTGWHQHSIGGGRTVTSIAAAATSDGLLDTVAIVANSAVDNTNHVCFLKPVFKETDAITSAWFVDDSAQAVGYGNAYAIGGAPGIVIYGLWHLNGQTVAAFCGGVDCGDWPVTNGQMTIPFYPSTLQANSLFTSDFVASFNGAMPIVAGFSYASQGQLLPPDTQPESGTRAGPGFGKVRRINKFAARLINTQGISFGTSFATGRMHKAGLRTTGGSKALAANQLFSGVHKDTIGDDYEGFASQLCWQITRPFPATIAAISGFLTSQDE